MFVVEVGAVLTTIQLAWNASHHAGQFGFGLQITLWLWFTVLFANFAEAMAEGRGKAQADTLRKSRAETQAHRLRSDGIGAKPGDKAIYRCACGRRARCQRGGGLRDRDGKTPIFDPRAAGMAGFLRPGKPNCGVETVGNRTDDSVRRSVSRSSAPAPCRMLASRSTARTTATSLHCPSRRRCRSPRQRHDRRRVKC